MQAPFERAGPIEVSSHSNGTLRGPLPHLENPGAPRSTTDTQSKSGGGEGIAVRRFHGVDLRLCWISAYAFLIAINNTSLRPILPSFVKSFGVGVTGVGMASSAFSLARLALNIPAGMAGDCIGRRPLLIAGPLIMALGELLTGWAPTFAVLLLWRGVTGVGSAVQYSGRELFLADISKATNRARTLGAVSAAMMAGAFAGPAIGGMLADAFGVRATFALAAAAGALAATLAACCLPETLRPPDTLTGDLQPLPYADRDSESESLLAGTRVAPARGGQPLSDPEHSNSASRTSHAVSWAVWKQLALISDFRAVCVLNAVIFMTVYGARSMFLPLIGHESLHLSNSSIGFMLSLIAAISFLLVMPGSMAADRFGRKWTIVPFGIVEGSALLMIALTSNATAFWIGTSLYAVGNAIIGASPSAYAIDVLPNEATGLGIGIFRSAGDLGSLLGSIILGAVADKASNHVALAVNAVLMLTTAAFFAVGAREVIHLRPDDNTGLELSGITKPPVSV